MMFRITFCPQQTEAGSKYKKQGEKLIINGEVFDFSPLTNGDTLPFEALKNPCFISHVKKENGIVSLRMIYQAEKVTDWSEQTIDVEDNGEIKISVFKEEVVQDEQ